MKKTNKLISILLAMVMLLTMAPLSLTASAASGTCGQNATWSLNKGVLTISGSGAMTDYGSSKDIPWNNEKDNITKVVVESGITWLDQESFKACYSMTSAEIKGNTTLTNYSFAYCGQLTSVVFGGTVGKITGTNAFNSCSKLTSFTLREGVGMSGNAFSGSKKVNVKLVDANGNDKTAYYTVYIEHNTSSRNYMTIKGNLEKGSITAIPDQIYTGSEVKPAVAVNWNGQTVSSNNYDLAYSNNIEEGTATVTVTGKGDYTGTLTQTFKIFECKHEGQAGICGVCGKNLHIHAYNYTANGNVITATCSNADGVCSDTNGGTLTISAPADLYADGTISREAIIDNQLVEPIDYTVTYSTADGAAPKTSGTYTASVTVGGATASVEFTLSDYAAKVTDKDGNLVGSFKTFDEAITAAEVNEESTLTLFDDITVAQEQYIKSGKFTLDLNGKNLISESGRVIELFADVVLTIKDSGEGGTIYGKGGGGRAIINRGTLTFESGTVKGDGGIENRGTLTFNNGTVEAGDYSAISNYNMVYVYDGVFRSTKSSGINNYGTAFVYDGESSGVLNEGTAYISGGKIFRNNYAALNLHSGTVEITGGSFSGTDSDNGYVSGTPYGERTVNYTEGATLTLKGGEFPNGFAVNEITANEFLADGYHFRNEQGKVVDGSSRIIKEKVIVEKGADFSADAVVNVDNVVYNGAAQEPTVTVKVGGKTLTEGKDYTLVFANNVNAGTATVTVKAVGQVAGGIVGGGNSNAGNSVESVYTGEITKEFTILKADSAVETSPTANEITYNGEAQALVTAGSSESGTVVYSLDGAEYSESIPTGTNAGEYTVYYKVEGDSNHNDSEPETVTVTIDKKSVTVSATVPDRIYGDDYRVDTSKVVVTFDGIVDGDDVGYAVIDAYYHVHTVTDNALVQVVYNVNGTDTGNYQFPEYGEYLAPNYSVQATGNVLPRDIADAQITLGEALTYNGAEQTQSIASVTVIGKDVTYTVSGNTATNVGVYELTITGNGNFTGTKTALYEIAPDTSAIDAITVDNVKSSDKEVIEAVANQLENAATDFADDAKKAEYKTITDKCNELLGTIAETEEKLEEIKGIESNYNPENVSSDDKAAIENKIAEIEAVNPDNLTEEQKAEYDEIKAGFEALIEEIEKAGSEVDAIGSELEMFDEERVTIFYEDEIEALKAKIDELLADENMGEAEKAKLNEYKAQCDNLIEIINTPAKYFSIRLFHFVWDALHWLSSHVVFIFNWIVSMF